MTGNLCEWWGSLIRLGRRSPILLFQRHVAASPSSVAPERTAELKCLLDEHDLQIVFVDEDKFGIRVSLETHQIILPVAAVEYIWAQSLRFWVVMQEYQVAQASGATAFDLHGNERLLRASRTVSWCMGNMKGTGREHWPSGLPRPKAKPRDEDGNVANQLFLGAMGWIILHEIGHVVLRHAEISGSYSQQQEKEADLFATAWVLDGIDAKEPAFTKRAFCIATALLCLQSLEASGAPRWKGTHPPAHERIDYCLYKYRGALSEKVIGFLIVCLQALFASTTVIPDIHDDSFDSILDGLFVRITRQSS